MNETRFSRACLVAAVALTLLWGTVYIACAYSELCDEPVHVTAAKHLAEGRPGLPALPYPPGYHLFVNALSLGHPTIIAARATSVVFAALALVAFAGSWRQLHQREAGPATLAFALLPILQPFTAMAYTDVTSVAWLLCAWWAQVSGHVFRASMLMGVACLVRQTNVIWAAFFVVWETLRALDTHRDAAFRWRPVLEAVWSRGRWHLLLIAAAAFSILALGRFTAVSVDSSIELKTNIAAFHFAAWLALVFGFPVWLRYVPEVLRSAATLLSGFRLVWLAALLLAAGLLGATFQNPHPWNQFLYGGIRVVRPYIFLHNWPLKHVDAHRSLHFASGASVVTAAFMTFLVFRRQPYRRALWAALLFGAILLGTNWFVDPRYYITPAVMLLCLLRFDRGTWLWLAAWFALLCAIHDPFIVAGRSLW